MKNKSTIGIFSLMIVGLLVLAGTASAFAMSEDREEVRDAIWEALENDDYDAWKSTIEAQLTEERFDSMVERHELLSYLRDASHETKVAIKQGDYDAYVEALQDLGVSEDVLTEEDFATLVELRQTMKDSADEKGHRGMFKFGNWD